MMRYVTFALLLLVLVLCGGCTAEYNRLQGWCDAKDGRVVKVFGTNVDTLYCADTLHRASNSPVVLE